MDLVLCNAGRGEQFKRGFETKSPLTKQKKEQDAWEEDTGFSFAYSLAGSSRSVCQGWHQSDVRRRPCQGL